MPKATDNIVEHALSGLQMPEATARTIDDLAKDLPADFKYRRLAKAADEFSTTEGERTDTSYITTDDVDRDGEVVLPSGLELKHYNRVVTFSHDYKALPIGSNWWIRPKMKGNRQGLVAKTHYPNKPADWGDAPWLPSAVLHLMQQAVPTCTGKSIGFIPLNIRQATQEEKTKRPELADVPIIDKAALIEYAVAPVPCNAEAEMVSVSKAVTKAIAEGVFDQPTADQFAAAFGVQLKDAAPMPSCPKCMSNERVRKKDDDGGMYTCSMCGDFKPETPADKSAREALQAALGAPYYTIDAYQHLSKQQRIKMTEWAKEQAGRKLLNAFYLRAGKV